MLVVRLISISLRIQGTRINDECYLLAPEGRVVHLVRIPGNIWLSSTMAHTEAMELARFGAGGSKHPMEAIPEQLSLGSHCLGGGATETLRFFARQIY